MHRLALLIACIAAPVSAQGVQPFVDCAAKADDAERLACYDRAAEAISAEARRVAGDREARRKAVTAAAAAAAAAAAEAQAIAEKRDSFGREGVRVLRGGGGGRVNELQARVTETLSSADGRHVFLLDNGQLWRQADAFRLQPLRAGTDVTIGRGSLGSYFLHVHQGNRRTAVVRMR